MLVEGELGPLGGRRPVATSPLYSYSGPHLQTVRGNISLCTVVICVLLCLALSLIYLYLYNYYILLLISIITESLLSCQSLIE